MTTMTLTDTAFRSAVRAAIRAPSLHNTQPWRFRIRSDGMEVCADPIRRLTATDPTDWGLRLACGAAAFNARLALAMLGHQTEARLLPHATDGGVLVRLVVVGDRPASPADARLFAAIEHRHSNRAPFWPQPVPADVRARLLEATRAEGAWLELLTGKGPVAVLGEIAQAADRVLGRDPGYLGELAAWTRTEESADDGVPASAGGPSPEPQDLLPARGYSDRPRAPGRDFEGEPLVAVLGTAGDTASDQLTAGMALQRVLLTITDAGLAASMFSQPIEVPTAREQLRVALRRLGAPQMVLRIGYGQPGFPTPRRDIDEVIDR